jgi:hypothetical protein
VATSPLRAWLGSTGCSGGRGRSQEHNEDCKRLLTLMGVPVVEAPSEAEAQCAEMAKGGLVYGVATEDMDALTFATPRLLRNLMAPQSQAVRAAAAGAPGTGLLQLLMLLPGRLAMQLARLGAAELGTWCARVGGRAALLPPPRTAEAGARV